MLKPVNQRNVIYVTIVNKRKMVDGILWDDGGPVCGWQTGNSATGRMFV